MTSAQMRRDPLFLRNEFEPYGAWDIPLIKKQNIDLENTKLIACSNTKKNDTAIKKLCGVHFFVDDYRFKGIYDNPSRTLEKYSQYAFLLTPDYSLYAEMPMWLQVSNVAKKRWVGAYWQSKGLTVIPTISWGSVSSFKFCFDGVEKNSIVAIGMIGSKKDNHFGFMSGYNEMCERINPRAVICFGESFAEMSGNIIKVAYRSSKKRAVS